MKPGRRFTRADVQEWAAGEMARLNIKTSGEPFLNSPVVLITSFDSSPSYNHKGFDDYNVSFNFDIASRSPLLTELTEVANKIISEMNFRSGIFTIQSYDFNIIASDIEEDEQGLLQRQIIQLNLLITYHELQ